MDTKVYSLTGKSGSGKSYRAVSLCRENGIESLIDDGLFICGGTIAGKSAKKEPTKVGAIKTAIFQDDSHAEEVKEAIRRCNPASLLILGTSTEMVDKITVRLELPPVSRYIFIEDIATPEEMAFARKQRQEIGTHVVPAPTMQVRKSFSGFILNPRRGMTLTSEGPTSPSEKTIVRPTYSYLGKFDMSERVISDIVKRAAAGTSGIASVLWVTSAADDAGAYIRAIVQVERGAKVLSRAEELQRRISSVVSYMTSLNVLGVEIEIRGFK